MITICDRLKLVSGNSGGTACSDMQALIVALLRTRFFSFVVHLDYIIPHQKRRAFRAAPLGNHDSGATTVPRTLR
jgi:hypothetical protein